jgi:hypothetical protein
MKKKQHNKCRQFTRVEFQEMTLDEAAGIPFPTVQKTIAEVREIAEEILTAAGLPTTARMQWERLDGVTVHGYLDGFISRQHPRDTQEWYAGKIIVTCHRLERATGQDAVDLAFLLGQYSAFARVYQLMDKGAAKGGRKSNKKEWAVKLAERFRGLSDDQIMSSLYAGEVDYLPIQAGGETFTICFIEDEEILEAVKIVHGDRPQKPETLRPSTFLKSYVRPARKKI